MKRRRWLWAGAALLGALVLDHFAYPALARVSGVAVDRGENALWIRYDWYFGEQQDYAGLARRLRDHGVRDAYFHVRSVLPNGSSSTAATPGG